MGSYGVKGGDYSCIFVYNLPQWAPKRAARGETGTERDSAFKKYIELPCRAYTASMKVLGIETGDVVSKLETSSFNFVGLLYVHLLVMTGVAAGDPRRRFFTLLRTAEREVVQDALCLTGDTYAGIKARLQYVRDQTSFPFLYPEADRKT